MNCWEYMKCGRDKTKDCPAYPFNGKNCWLSAGTLCGGKVQGTFAQKIGNCTKCEYYKLMSEEHVEESAAALKKYYG